MKSYLKSTKLINSIRIALVSLLGLLPIIYTVGNGLVNSPASAKLVSKSESQIETKQIANPVSINMTSTKLFQNVIEDGDMMAISLYDIEYADNATPTELPSEAFLYSLYDTDNTTILQSESLESNVYGYGITGMYFSKDDVTNLNLHWNSLYYIKLMGNPAIFTSIVEGTNQITVQLTASYWIAGFFGEEASKDRIKTYCIGIATRIQTAENVTTVVLTSTAGYVLNSLGRNMLLLAIPGLDNAVPNLFQTVYTDPNLTGDNFTQTYQGQLSVLGQLGAQTKAAFDGIGEYLGFNGGILIALWAFLLVLMVASIAFLYSGNVTASIIIAIPMAFIGVFVGAFPLWIFFVIIALVVVYSAYFLFLRGI